MKKMPLATALALLLQDVLNRRLLFKQTAAVAPKETITHHFFVSELGRRKLSMQPKFVAAQKMLLKQKPSKHWVNGLLGFITLGIYTRWKRVYCRHISQAELPIDISNSICTAH